MIHRIAISLLCVFLLAVAGCGPSERTQSSTEDQTPPATIPTQAREQPSQPLSTFLDDASLQVVLRSPEVVTQLGISSWIGVRDDGLTPQSRAYELETINLLESLTSQLRLYDLAAEDPSTAMSARVYGWYLEDLLEAHRFADHAYPVNTHLSNYTDGLERLMTRYHPLQTFANAEDYLTRLAAIAPRIGEIIVRFDESAAIGALPPRFILEAAADALEQSAEVPAQETAYYTAFVDQLDAIDSLAPDRKLEMRESAHTIVASSVLPAYRLMATKVREVAEESPDGAGVWRHTNGDAYYAYRLRKYTTTELTAQEIHDLGLQEVARIQSEVATLAESLGYEPASEYAGLYRHLTSELGTTTGQQAVEDCESLIQQITDVVRPAFSTWPEGEIAVIEGRTNAFFVPSPLDGSRPSMFYAPAGREEPLFSLTTLVCHEAIPGHGLQTMFAQNADLPPYRAGLGISAYAEGWALYAERLAWEMGLYEDDPAGNLGRLQGELWRAVRLVVDTGIHAFRWDYEQAVQYMLENAGLDEPLVRQEVERYIVAPGQACAYKIGMLEILRQRDRAQDALKEAFSLTEFHDAILSEGDVPLYILDELVSNYISTRAP